MDVCGPATRRPFWHCAWGSQPCGAMVPRQKRSHASSTPRLRRLTATFKELTPEPWSSRIHNGRWPPMAIPSARPSRTCGLGARPGTTSSTAQPVPGLGLRSVGRLITPEDRRKRLHPPLSDHRKKSCRHERATKRRRSRGATGEQALGERGGFFASCSAHQACVS